MRRQLLAVYCPLRKAAIGFLPRDKPQSSHRAVLYHQNPKHFLLVYPAVATDSVSRKTVHRPEATTCVALPRLDAFKLGVTGLRVFLVQVGRAVR